MRVLFVAPKLYTGGAERVWSILIPGLRRRGLDVSLLTLKGEGELFDDLVRAGVEARCAGMSSRLDLAGLRRALAISPWTPDLVVSWSVSANVVGAVIARRARAPHLVTEHGSMADGERTSRMKLHRRLLLRLVARRADGAICVSPLQISTMVNEGFREETIHIIPNGVPEPRPANGRDAIRGRLGVGAGDFVALIAATLRPVKRVDVFVDALLVANERDPRIRGLVAGDGPEEEAVRTRSGEPTPALTFLGFRRDMDELLYAADVVCLTSDAEVMPMVLLEAMALEKPVIATAVGGIPEVLGQGDSGHLIPRGDPGALADALVELACDPEQAGRLGRNGRSRYLQQWTADEMVDSYARVLSSVVERHCVAGTW